ncbi:tRNA-modifying protein YgfZ [Thalassotalea litorea]|uniref:tRNA-modifying protein YgfZ n=1 Tax=Thalassotalea litorea TaxID=2020715 RepID=A0A5R9IHT5_9GAMM|nr:tRNA-modifying protein YgfZ [Thalassotalea litorea]TLU59902.1 tRNA-modifying protein YgfZ [Thalassotalea litorea]
MKVDSSHPSLESLPAAYACRLANQSMICVSGDERYSYLQGQLTCDVNSLSDNPLLTGAHCDAKGKVFSAFRLFEHGDQLMMLMTPDSAKASLEQLNKFAVFAKAELQFSDDQAAVLSGDDIDDLLSSHVDTLPDVNNPVITHQQLTLIKFDGHKAGYIIVGSEQELTAFLQGLDIVVFDSAIWSLLEVVNGSPSLASGAVGEYVPQMLNLQAINGISFTKGCYMGQETVARMKYLGKNKRAMFCLQGKSTQLVDANQLLEKQLGDNWRRGGNITSVYQADDGSLYIQAVLANDTNPNDIFRIKDLADTVLTQMPLPYELDD